MRTIYIILYPVVMLEWLYNPLGISFNARILGDGKYDEKPHAGWDHSLMKTTSREPSWVTVQGQKTFTESTPKKKTEHLAILCTFHHPASSNKTCSKIYFTPWNKIVNLSRIKCNHAWCRLVIRYAPKKKQLTSTPQAKTYSSRCQDVPSHKEKGGFESILGGRLVHRWGGIFLRRCRCSYAVSSKDVLVMDVEKCFETKPAAWRPSIWHFDMYNEWIC